MLELAITQGVEFVAYTRNAKDIKMPNGDIVCGPLDLSALPHVAGDYAIRDVKLVGPEPGPLEIGGTEPPVVEGEAVVVRRTVTALPEEMVAARAAQDQEQAWAVLRTERDKRLIAATAILDRHRNQRDFGLPTTLTDADATAWATYAQSLRDLPEATVDPASPEWPVEPGHSAPTA